MRNGIKYFAVAAFDDKIYPQMLNKLAKVDKTITQIRFVIQIGVPNSRDPEGAWLKDGAGFKDRFDIFERRLSDVRFNGTRIDNSRIKIYGAIPQVRSLQKKYPMEKIYVFN